MAKFTAWQRACVLAVLFGVPAVGFAQYNLQERIEKQLKEQQRQERLERRERAANERSARLPEQAPPAASGEMPASCNRAIEPLAPQPDTMFFWLAGGARFLPDLAQLRPGDGLVVRAESGKEALDNIRKVKERIQREGGSPERYKYIVRAFPPDLMPVTQGGRQVVPFFSSLSSAELKELQSDAFAIMFDHERVHYDRAPGRLPPWSWDYRWAVSQIHTLAQGIVDRCIPAGVLATPSARKEGRWTRPDGTLMPNAFAQLLDTKTTGISYLIVQAQPRCRDDASGSEYGQFARQLRQELRSVFPNDPGKARNVVLQVAIDDKPHPTANYVPPDWTATCIAATRSAATAGSPKEVNGFFLWSANRKATCEAVKRVRAGADVVCKD